MRWTGHGKRKILKEHQMEKGSLHPMGQVVTLHQTKQKEGMWDWYLQAISYLNSIQIKTLEKTNQHEERCKIERKFQGQNFKFSYYYRVWKVHYSYWVKSSVNQVTDES